MWDQEGCIGQWRHGRSSPDRTRPERSLGRWGWGSGSAKPADPEAKGVVERANGYFETSFLPGRSFDDVADFNAPAGRLVDEASQRAGSRHDPGQRPAEAIFEDRGSMLALPATAA